MTDAATKTTPSLIGQSFVLWIVHWSKAATTDGAGRKHDGWVVDEEIPVVVTEEKPVKGHFQSGEFTGIKAKASDGREFSRHWQDYPDDVVLGVDMRWYARDKAGGTVVRVVDACLAHRYRRVAGPCVGADGILKIPAGAEVCWRHDSAFLPQVGCRDCKFDEMEGREYIKCPHCDSERPLDDLPSQRSHMETEHPDETAKIDAENHRLDGWADI